MKKVHFTVLFFLSSLFSTGKEIEINVLSAPRDRTYIWCIQSPFDSQDSYVECMCYLKHHGVRITLVSGEEAHISRPEKAVEQEATTIIGQPKRIIYTAELGEEVYMVTKDEEIRIYPGTRLAAEVLAAFRDYQVKKSIESFEEGSSEALIIEALNTEPVAGGDATR